MEARLTGIERGQVLQYLGCRGGELSDALLADVARCEALLRDAAEPRAV